MLKFCTYLCLVLCLCFGQVNAQEPSDNTGSQKTLSAQRYKLLLNAITRGIATRAEVKQALTHGDAGGLTNIMHALYAMRSHRPVYIMMHDMWNSRKEKLPDLPWDLIEKPPVRIALASTLNRIEILRGRAYKTYIRSFKDDPHEFNRAQVVVALGLNGDPVDIPYIKEMADGHNHYVVQSAITALALMNDNHAKNALIELREKYIHAPRGELIENVLQKAYKWYPPEDKDV